MYDVHDWLNRLGLGQYTQVFKDNKIEPEVLPELNANDLKKIGIPLVHRKKLLKAFAAISADASSNVAPASSETMALKHTDTNGETRAELRQLTVMFCDLVGSTRLSEMLDPEDLAEIICAYRDICNDVIRRFGGFVARYVGDGILVFFGYPKAHEDDAERSLRAALEIVRLIAKLDVLGVSLSVRIGIATGPVLVGDYFDSDSTNANSVFGQTPNLAARLQGMAVPNSVIIGTSTQRLSAGKFIYEDLGRLKLKGISRSTRAYRVVGESEIRSRFEVIAAKGLTPLVGREEELELLAKRWELAIAGQGQMVLVSGGAGIGKSRLVSEFYTRLRSKRHFHLQLQCSPYHQNSALYPVIERLKLGLRFASVDDPGQRLDTLRVTLSDLGLTSDDHLAYIASLLGMPLEEHVPALAAEPEQVRRQTAKTLLTMFQREALRHPVLIVVEDLHWCDPSTLEFLGLLIEHLCDAQVVMIATFRPEFILPWQTGAHITLLPLVKLDSRDSKDLIARLVGDRPIPKSVLEEILAKCDGIPLFIEELTRAVIEEDAIQNENERTGAARHSRLFTIPSSLQDSLIARLDDLSSGKEVAQLASMLGRSFSYELLAAISTEDDAALQRMLSDLVAARLLYQRGEPPTATYEFKHALMQDAAYQLLLKRTRRQFHGRIAEVLEQQFPETAESQPEILAYHWTEAQQALKAVRYWLSAGQLASGRSAMFEAVAHFQKGLELVGGISEDQERKRLELEMQIPLAAALMATEGPGSQEVEAAYVRALGLSSKVPRSPLHFAATWGSWRIAMDFRTGRERADNLLQLARSIGDAELVLQAHHCQWATLFMLGEQEACCRHIEEGLKLYDPEEHFSHSGVYGGHDAKVCALGEAGLSFCLRGYPDQALRHAEAALEWARQLNHAGSLAHALDYAVMLSRYRRDVRVVLRHAEDMIRFSEEQELVDHGVKGRFFRGYALAHFGQVDRGLSEMRESLDIELRIGTEEDFPVYFEMLAEVAALAGRYDESLRAIEQMAPNVEGKGLRYWSAELHRRHGEVLLARSDDSGTKAEDQFRQALAISREQDAKLLELRALSSLVRLRGKSGKKDSPYKALCALVSSFPEQRETSDLMESKALLVRL